MEWWDDGIVEGWTNKQAEKQDSRRVIRTARRDKLVTPAEEIEMNERLAENLSASSQSRRALRMRGATHGAIAPCTEVLCDDGAMG